jgi:tripartite-type tricarboxylate transporter receptor subunit TctC
MTNNELPLTSNLRNSKDAENPAGRQNIMPRTNGKAERFVQASLREWAHARHVCSDSTPPSCGLAVSLHRALAAYSLKDTIRRRGEDNLLNFHSYDGKNGVQQMSASRHQCTSKNQSDRRFLGMPRGAILKSILCMAALVCCAVPPDASTQDYPSSSITVVVPFPPGGPSDVVARIVTDHMARTLGHQLVIENVAGAGGTLGSARVATSAPDGYTLLAGSMGSHVAAPVLTPNLKYNPSRDFAPIGFTAHSPAVITARRDFPAKDVAEFIAYLKIYGDQVKQAHGGIGASSHMACLLFTSQLGLKPTLVAYRGTGPAVNDLIGGHVDFLCEQSVSVAEQIKAETVKGYVVSAPERLPALPNIPAAREVGLKYDLDIWAGIFAPNGVRKEVVGKLAAALDKALDDPIVAKRLADLGASIPAKKERNPTSFDRLVKTEIARWSPILKAASASPN